jgi:hypothetical protein
MSVPSRTEYRVFLHSGNCISSGTRVGRGVAWLDDAALYVQGDLDLRIPGSQILAVSLLRVRPLGQTLQIDYGGGRLFLAALGIKFGPIFFMSPRRTKRLKREVARCFIHS